MIEIDFIKLYETSFKQNWSLNALTNLNDNTTLTYGEVAKEIARMHILFEKMGVNVGDKIALIGGNHSSWAIVFLATITYGAVIVPILQDYHPSSMENIMIHSDTKIGFIDRIIWENISREKITFPVFTLSYFDILHGEETIIKDLKLKIDNKFLMKYPTGFDTNDVKYKNILKDTIVCINYTSGYKNFTRGVMLTADNYYYNILATKRFNIIFKGEKNIVFLPLAHAFSCMSDFLYPLSVGAHLNFLSKTTNPKVLFKKFQKLKPHHISIVPFVLESVFSTQMELIKKKTIFRTLLKIPLFNKIAFRKIRKSLIKVFGGNYRELVVGGAALNKDIEDFLMKIKFPFSVGYGMTECGPLISYSNYKYYTPRSCGKVIEKWMEARIDSSDPLNIPGEIQVKGKHVMKGYYKDVEATRATFTQDGWLKTGDLGLKDVEGRLYIKGLVKNMILGSSGQNIYPREIEFQLNKLPFVSRSRVVGKNNLLKAVVYPDFNQMEKQNISVYNLEKIMKENRRELNKNLARYERIGSIEIMHSEFEKAEVF